MSRHPAHPRHRAGPASRLFAAAFSFLVLILLLPTPAHASTSVTQLAASPSALAMAQGASPPPISQIGLGIVLLTKATSTFPTAGRQTAGTLGLSGATVRVAACRVGPCTDGYRSAAPSTLVAGTYAEELVISYLQPSRLGAPFSFDIEVGVETTGGWTIFHGYFSSGSGRSPAAQIVHLDLFLDLGSRAVPRVLAIHVSLNPCLTLRSCP